MNNLLTQYNSECFKNDRLWVDMDKEHAEYFSQLYFKYFNTNKELSTLLRKVITKLSKEINGTTQFGREDNADRVVLEWYKN